MANIKTALITGASRGLGLALARVLAQQGWRLLINGRNAQQLLKAYNELNNSTEVIAISGDVRDEIHLLQLQEALANNNWTLDLVVNNASTLGASPLVPLLDHPVNALHSVFHTNIIAPISLIQKVTGYLSPHATIINISSDAAKAAYPNWGAYSSSKAGLDHLTAILAAENPQWHIYAFDPGDMRTDMHQAAFPGEDISDRPKPEEQALPAILQLVQLQPESSRYTAAELMAKARASA
ncbi:MAG: SDR family oxidoreductase [Bacteroidota bacterium]